MPKYKTKKCDRCWNGLMYFEKNRDANFEYWQCKDCNDIEAACSACGEKLLYRSKGFEDTLGVERMYKQKYYFRCGNEKCSKYDKAIGPISIVRISLHYKERG